MKRAFTMVELLVVISVITLLMGILIPAMGEVRLHARVLVVNAELRDIGLALEAYSLDNDGRYPPTRIDCAAGDHFYQLPVELVDSKYLPTAGPNTYMSSGIQDRFNPGYTYKYRSVGMLIYNRTVTMQEGASLWVPDNFPDNDPNSNGQYYNNADTSPVSWVLYSQGPSFDLLTMKQNKYPVPQETWYDPATDNGIIVRMRLQNSRQIGTFEK